MGVINQLLNVGSVSLVNQQTARTAAIKAGFQRCLAKKIGDAADISAVLAQGAPNANSVDVREFQPILDAGTTLDQWNTAALAAVGTAYSVFQAITAPQLANNKLVVFWGIQVETVPLPVSRVIFRSGSATGNLIGMYDLEQMVTRQEGFGFFSTPVVIDPSLTFAVQVLCRVATGVIARVQLAGYVFEPTGQTLATQ